MPTCHRCQRCQATAELRRTSLGYVCKENGRGSRCWTEAHARRAPQRLFDLDSERQARRGPEAMPPTERAEESVA